MKILYVILTACAAAFIWQACGNKSGEGFGNLSADEFERLIEDKDVQCVDVRTVAEYSEGHIPGSLNINVLDKRFIYCKSGRRSRNAARLLTEKGFKVYNLDKGFEDWKKTGKDIER